MDQDEMIQRVADSLRLSAAARPAVEECVSDGVAIVEKIIGGAVVPDRIKALAVVETASELYHRRGSRAGLAAFGDSEPQVIRISRDPSLAAKEVLRHWLGLPVA